MGMRGPRPVPTEILAARGSWLAKVRGGRVASDGVAPRCPARFHGDRKKMWRSLIGELRKLGVLSSTDRGAMVRYCDMFVRWEAAAKLLEQQGEIFTLKDEKGNIRCVQQLPHVAIYSGLNAALTKLEQEFGLTPSARSRMELAGVEAEKPVDKRLAYFDGPKLAEG